MRASIPTNVVDNSYAVFPEGTYTGHIASAEVRDPKGDGTWQTLKIGLDSVMPIDDTPDPGRQRFAADITIVTDGFDLREIEDFSKRDIPYAIVRAGGLLGGMAEALGLVTREGGRMEVDLLEVVTALTEGNFASEAVAFQVTHYIPKNAPDKPREQFGSFRSAS